MFAVVFHVWLGVILAFVAVFATIGVVVGYLKKVVAPQYPPSNRTRRDD